jgi:hypothetical protein
MPYLHNECVIQVPLQSNGVLSWNFRDDTAINMRGLLYKTLVVYDTLGEEHGQAWKVAERFCSEGKIDHVYVLRGTTTKPFSAAVAGSSHPLLLFRWPKRVQHCLPIPLLIIKERYEGG